MVGSSNAMPACSRGPVLKPLSPRTHSIEQVGAIGCRPQPRSVVLRCQPSEASPRSKTMGKVLGRTVAVIVYLCFFFARHLLKSLLVFGRGKWYSISRAQRSSKPLPSFSCSSSGLFWFRPFPPWISVSWRCLSNCFMHSGQRSKKSSGVLLFEDNFARHLLKSLLVFGGGKWYSISRAQRSSKPLPSFSCSSNGSVWFRPFPPWISVSWKCLSNCFMHSGQKSKKSSGVLLFEDNCQFVWFTLAFCCGYVQEAIALLSMPPKDPECFSPSELLSPALPHAELGYATSDFLLLSIPRKQ